MRNLAGTFLLTAVLAGSAGCFAAVRIYDEPHRDYHRWDDREERAYRAYLTEQHREYREFKRLERRDQEEYWAWRHNHPDRDRR
jgi:hypothetical protein